MTNMLATITDDYHHQLVLYQEDLTKNVSLSKAGFLKGLR